MDNLIIAYRHSDACSYCGDSDCTSLYKSGVLGALLCLSCHLDRGNIGTLAYVLVERETGRRLFSRSHPVEKVWRKVR